MFYKLKKAKIIINTWGLPINIKIHHFTSILTGITFVTQVHPLRKVFPLKKTRTNLELK